MPRFILFRECVVSIFRLFLNLIYPSCCRGCDSLIFKEAFLCDVCKKRIQSITSITFKLTFKQSLKVFAASVYKQPLKNVILKKFQEDMLASKQLAHLILERVDIKNLDTHYIVPIPLYWMRYAKRGFNQSKVMAVQLGRSLEIPVLDVLKRNRKTAFQSSLTGLEKEENVKGAFEIKGNQIDRMRKMMKDKNILLVDDLATSGATLKNAARVLLNLKPKSVMAVVAARQC